VSGEMQKGDRVRVVEYSDHADPLAAWSGTLAEDPHGGLVTVEFRVQRVYPVGMVRRVES
jgi:hypothetical protein